jgi:hypothetical protein
MATVALTLRVLVAVVLGWSAVSKLTPAGRRGLDDMFRQLGIGRNAGLAGGLLVAGETGSAVLLLVPWTAVVGAVLASGVLAVLTLGVLVILHRRMKVTCACFGSPTTRIAPVHAVRNCVLLAAALGAAAFSVASRGAPGDLLAVAVAIAVGGLLAVVITRLDDFVFLLAPR